MVVCQAAVACQVCPEPQEEVMEAQLLESVALQLLEWVDDQEYQAVLAQRHHYPGQLAPSLMFWEVLLDL